MEFFARTVNIWKSLYKLLSQGDHLIYDRVLESTSDNQIIVAKYLCYTHFFMEFYCGMMK